MARYVNITPYRLILEEAEYIIKSFCDKYGFQTKPPIPVDLIAQSMFNLNIQIANLRSSSTQIMGALSVSDQTILSADDISWKRYRLLVAHEIGHWVIHEGNLYETEGIDNSQEPDMKKFLRSTGISNEKTRHAIRETEVNWFSHLLLIPRSMLLQEAKRFEIIDLHAIRELASIFNVSNHVMYYHIKELRDHLFWDGPAIDNALADIFYNAWSRIEPTKLNFGDHNSQQGAKKITKKITQPKIIDFSGTSNAGKNTEIDIVSDVLQDVYGYRVRVIDEGIRDCFIDKNFDLERLFKTISVAVERLYEARYENPGNFDYVILNRGPFDRLAFLLAAQKLGRITKELEEIHTKYLLSYAHLVDIVFLFQISPEESIRREYNSKRQYIEQIAKIENKVLQPQRILNQETLSVMNSAYIQLYKQYEKRFGCIYLLEGDEVDILSRSVELITAIIPPVYRQLDMPDLFKELFKLSSKEAENSLASH